MSVLAFVIVVAAVARVTRFITSDSLWEELRAKWLGWLQDTKGSDGEPKSKRTYFLHRKIATLMDCSWCVSLYVSAAALVAHRIFVGSFAIPVWTWLAVSMFAVCIIEFNDGEKLVAVRQNREH